jgi:hypothetical protein
VRRAVHRAGIASALEPALRRLPGLAKGASTPADGSAIGVQAPGDILLLLSQGISITDVSVIHPVILNALPHASATAGEAAAQRDQQKWTAYARVEPNGYGLLPSSLETYGYVGQPAMKLLHVLGDEAAGPGGVTQVLFVAGTLQEPRIGLCRGIFVVVSRDGRHAG